MDFDESIALMDYVYDGASEGMGFVSTILERTGVSLVLMCNERCVEAYTAVSPIFRGDKFGNVLTSRAIIIMIFAEQVFQHQYRLLWL